MPAKDLFHQAVKSALEKEQWLITADPLFISVEGVDMSIDLGAEELLAAERNGRKIAVEIKSFIGTSEIYDFHLALGQFMNYRLALQKKEPERTLYLAVPAEAYETFFVRPFVQSAIASFSLKLLIYAPDREVIVQWIN